MPERQNHVEVLKVPESQFISRGFIEEALSIPENNETPIKLWVWIDGHIQGEIKEKVATQRELDMISGAVSHYAEKWVHELEFFNPERIESSKETRRKKEEAGHPPDPPDTYEIRRQRRREVAYTMWKIDLENEIEVIDYMFEQASSISTPTGAVVIPAQT